MKITYTQAVLEIIESLETLPFSSPWDTRNAISSIRYSFIKSLPAVIEARDSTSHLREYSWERTSVDFKQTEIDGKIITDYENVIFTVSRSFESKDEMQTWLSANGFKLPRMSEKTSSMFNDKPHVIYHYKITQGDFVLNVSYLKEGLPSAHCYVREVVETHKSIVCNLK